MWVNSGRLWDSTVGQLTFMISPSDCTKMRSVCRISLTTYEHFCGHTWAILSSFATGSKLSTISRHLWVSGLRAAGKHVLSWTGLNFGSPFNCGISSGGLGGTKGRFAVLAVVPLTVFCDNSGGLGGSNGRFAILLPSVAAISESAGTYSETYYSVSVIETEK